MRMRTVEGVAIVYVCALACGLPFILATTLRVLTTDFRALLVPVVGPVAAAALAFGAVEVIRSLAALPEPAILRTAILAAVFLIVDVGLIALFPQVALSNIRFLRGTMHPPFAGR